MHGFAADQSFLLSRFIRSHFVRNTLQSYIKHDNKIGLLCVTLRTKFCFHREMTFSSFGFISSQLPSVFSRVNKVNSKIGLVRVILRTRFCFTMK